MKSLARFLFILTTKEVTLMVLNYQRVQEHPRVFRALTSLDVQAFEQLLPSFRQAWDGYVQEHFIDRPRQRRYGAGRKPTLQTAEDKLLFILVYLKCYPLQEVLGFLFGMSQSQANVWIHRLSEVLTKALELGGSLPERDPEKLPEVLADYQVWDFLLDGTERRRQRPKDPEEQRRFYSGKKKAHTVKNNVIVHAATGQIAYLGPTCEGKRHDKRLADEEGYAFPPNSVLVQDTGFQGFSPERVIVLQPKKKPRGKPMPGPQRVLNRVVSRFRIQVEHAIAGVKRCRIVKEVFRSTQPGFIDTVVEVACGLHNFRSQLRHPYQTVDLLDYFQ